MKKIVSSALVLSALTLTSAVAADLPSKKPAPAPVVSSGIDAYASFAAGYNFGNMSIGGIGTDANGLNLAGRATFAAPISGGFGFQADGNFERSVNNKILAGMGSDADLVRNTGDVAGHLYMRNSTGLVGVIGQASVSEINLGILSDRRYYGGLEAQYYLGNVTLYGQAAYQNANFGTFDFGGGGGIGLGAQGANLMGQVRYFMTPNAMLALKGAYETIETDSMDGVTLRHNSWLVGLRGEYRFDQSPISAFADIDYRSGEFNTAGSKEHETRAMLGLKYNFGSKTLLDRDRNGASLDPVRSLKAILPLAGFPQ